MKLTDQQRAELRALAAAATPGPWDTSVGLIRAIFGDYAATIAEMRSPYRYGVSIVKGEREQQANAAFIAAANPAAVLDLLSDLEEAILQEDETSANNGYLSEDRQNLLAENADLRRQLVEAERKIALCIKSREDEIAEREAELAATRQQLADLRRQLAETQAFIIDDSRAITYQSLGQYRGALKQALFRAENYNQTHALQSAIEQAVAPYKREAERLRDALVLAKVQGSKKDRDQIIDAALSAKEKSNG